MKKHATLTLAAPLVAGSAFGRRLEGVPQRGGLDIEPNGLTPEGSLQIGG